MIMIIPVSLVVCIASNLTTWGFQDCARDPTNGAFGAAIPKLLLRHLPRHYPANSVYSLFPFFTPKAAEKILRDLGIVGKYNLKRPSTVIRVPKVVDTITGIDYVFSNPDKFKVTYGSDMKPLTNGFGFMLVFDEKAKYVIFYSSETLSLILYFSRHDWFRGKVIHALFPDRPTIKTYVDWYKSKTADLIKQHSYQISGIPGKRVDVVRNVINLVAVHWASNWLIGAPLKTADSPAGLFTEQQMYDILMLLCTCVFINVLPERGFFLKDQAQIIGDKINALIDQSIEAAAPSTTVRVFF